MDGFIQRGDQEEYKRYKPNILDIPDVSTYICQHCQNILNNPYQNTCGHRFCKACLEEVCQEKNVRYPCLGCYADNIEAEYVDKSTAFPDRGIGLQLNRLQAKCPTDGCSWSGEFREYKLHEEVCTKDKIRINQVGKSRIIDGILRSRIANTEDGFTWVITDLQNKIAMAKIGIMRVFSSPPFYTPDGYNLGFCVYLNGDGMGKGNYLSLFAIIYKGENDGNISWPFRKKVTFLIINQIVKDDHLVDCFTPDNSSSFQRPTADKNTPSGCSLFCPLQTLFDPHNGFVKNDSIIIKMLTD